MLGQRVSTSRWALATTLLLVAGSATPAVMAHAAPEDFIATKAHRTVCVLPYDPMDVCGADGTTGFTGYEPELFKQVAQYLAAVGFPEWAPGNWSFTCYYDTSTAYDMVTQSLNDGTCDVALGGITTDSLDPGAPLKLTYSTYHSGRRVMVYRDYPPARWAFLRPLTSGVWLLTFASAVVVAVVVLGLEAWWCRPLPSCSRTKASRSSSSGYACGVGGSSSTSNKAACSRWMFSSAAWQDIGQGYSSVQWSTMGLLLQGVHQLSPSSPGARIVVAAFALFSTLVFCIYTAASSAGLTVAVRRSEYVSFSDLQRQVVGVWEGDADTLLAAYEFDKLVRLQWNTDADADRIMQLLREGRLDAVISDGPWIQHQISVHCDLFETGIVALPSNMVFALPAQLSDAYMEHFDLAIQTLWSHNVMDELLSKYVTAPSICSTPPPIDSFLTVQPRDVGGLWYFLAACIGIGLLMNLATLIWGQSNDQPPSGAAALALPARFKLHHNTSGSTEELSLDVSHTAARHQCQQVDAPSEDHWSQKHAYGATISDRVQTLNRRLDKLDDAMASIPQLMADAMDRELLVLRVEIGRVMANQMRRRVLSQRDSGVGFRDSKQGQRVLAKRGGSARQLRLPNFPGQANGKPEIRSGEVVYARQSSPADRSTLPEIEGAEIRSAPIRKARGGSEAMGSRLANIVTVLPPPGDQATLEGDEARGSGSGASGSAGSWQLQRSLGAGADRGQSEVRPMPSHGAGDALYESVPQQSHHRHSTVTVPCGQRRQGSTRFSGAKQSKGASAPVPRFSEPIEPSLETRQQIDEQDQAAAAAMRRLLEWAKDAGVAGGKSQADPGVGVDVGPGPSLPPVLVPCIGHQQSSRQMQDSATTPPDDGTLGSPKLPPPPEAVRLPWPGVGTTAAGAAAAAATGPHISAEPTWVTPAAAGTGQALHSPPVWAGAAGPFVALPPTATSLTAGAAPMPCNWPLAQPHLLAPAAQLQGQPLPTGLPLPSAFPAGPPVMMAAAAAALPVPAAIGLPTPALGLHPLRPISDAFYEDDEYYEEDDDAEEVEEPDSYEIA